MLPARWPLANSAGSRTSRNLGARVAHPENFVEIDGMQNLFEIVVQRGALARIEDGVVGEIGGSVGLVGGHQTNEIFLRHGLQGVIQSPLIAQRRDGIGGKLLAAERAGAMGRINQRLVGKREQLVVQRVVKVSAEVVRGPSERSAQVGAANVADEQRIAGEDGVRFVRGSCGDRRPGSRSTRWCGRGFRGPGDAVPGNPAYRRLSSARRRIRPGRGSRDRWLRDAAGRAAPDGRRQSRRGNG